MFQLRKSAHISLFTVVFILTSFNIRWINGQGSSLARSTEFRDDGEGEILAQRSPQLNPHEPSCEELRAMWRYSKRQSRAAEMTNEIPTYRDPYAYNVWDPYYPTTRSGGGIRINSRYHYPARPVFGFVRTTVPVLPLRDVPDRSGIFGYLSKQEKPQLRQKAHFRSFSQPKSNALTPQKGSFQLLKHIVWSERTEDQRKQRLAEEMEARVAVLKEIANGHRYGPRPNDATEPMLREGYDTDVLPPSSASISTSKAVVDERIPENAKSSYPHYNDNSWLSSPSSLMRPSYTRQRNRSKLRHGFPDSYYSGSRRETPSSYASSEEE